VSRFSELNDELLVLFVLVVVHNFHFNVSSTVVTHSATNQRPFSNSVGTTESYAAAWKDAKISIDRFLVKNLAILAVLNTIK